MEKNKKLIAPLQKFAGAKKQMEVCYDEVSNIPFLLKSYKYYVPAINYKAIKIEKNKPTSCKLIITKKGKLDKVYKNAELIQKENHLPLRLYF